MKVHSSFFSDSPRQIGNHPNVHKHVNQFCYIHSMEYNLAGKKKKNNNNMVLIDICNT